MAATLDDRLALPPAPEPRRPNILMVGTFLAIAAGVMFFGGLLGSYDAARKAADIWPPEEVSLPNVALLVTYATLLMSSVTAQWAVEAARMGDRRQLYLAVGTTLLLGLAFINGLSFCWSQMGIAAGADPYSTTVWAVSGSHAIAVIGALVYFSVMGFRALGGQLSPRNPEFVRCAAAFWHFTAAAGAVIWFVLWFLEGGP
jgi:heme/copper-type cytochrome/quinol oxidase subunit 3